MIKTIASKCQFSMKYSRKPILKGVKHSEEIDCISSLSLYEIILTDAFKKSDKSSTFMYFYKIQSGNFVNTRI